VPAVPILRDFARATSVPSAGLLAGWAIVTLAFLIPGCNSEPQVASDLPQVRAAATPDISGPLPKGMPKTSTFKIDPATGRMMGPG
jgi:hypothetical protein